MPRTLGEMKRSRQITRRSFTGTCDVQRATSVASEGPGEPDVETYTDHLLDVPCRYIHAREVETERSGRIVRLRTATVAVPHGTDITGGDLISAVYDIERNQINAGNLSILGVDRFDGHLECVVEELAST